MQMVALSNYQQYTPFSQSEVLPLYYLIVTCKFKMIFSTA